MTLENLNFGPKALDSVLVSRNLNSGVVIHMNIEPNSHHTSFLLV